MTPIKVGLISTGSDAEKKGFPLNTTLLGNSNAGHMYGTNLSDEKKWLLSEHMKTLQIHKKRKYVPIKDELVQKVKNAYAEFKSKASE